MRRFILVGILGLLTLGPVVYCHVSDGFQNLQKEVTCKPAEIVQATSTEDVQKAVRHALQQHVPIKAAVNNWAGSNDSSCVDAGGIQINTAKLNKIMAIDKATQQVRVQPGMKLWDLNVQTHQLASLMLTGLQEYADVTIGGMLGNGTHGSTLGQKSSSIQDYILSATAVDAKGEIQTITGPDLDFIATNLGVLGILTEVTLQMEPSFKVEAKVSSYDEKDLESTILEKASSAYAASITWFPGQQKYQMTQYDKVPNETPGEAHNGQTETDWLKREIFPIVFKAAHQTKGRELMCLMEKERYEMKIKSFFTEEFAKPVTPAVGWGHEMMSFICRDKCPFDNLPFVLEEMAIDIHRLPEFIRDAKQVFAINRPCLPLNGIYFRFGKASRGAIGMASGRDSVYIGMEYVKNPWGDRYVKDFDVIQELEQMLLHKYEARPHWGKNGHSMFQNAKDKYPRFNEFEAYRSAQDPEGRFTNAFYKNIQAPDASENLAKNCVVDQHCYCQTDEHCPDGFSCQAGIFYKEARVCRR